MGNNLSRYDQDLLSAKKKGSIVHLELSTETSFSDQDGIVLCEVLYVDRFQVHVRLHESTSELIEVWIAKSYIVGTSFLGAAR